jgi:hypothetical protein
MAAENREGTKVMPMGRPFAPGVSGNPGGRPPGLARLAREATGDGADIVGFFVLVSRGVKPEGWPDAEKLTADHMIHANEWLADRGFGKAPLIVVNDPDASDEYVRTLTLEELREARHALDDMRGAIEQAPAAIPASSTLLVEDDG